MQIYPIQKSNLLLIFVILVHAAAAISLLLLSVSIWIKFILFGLVLGYFNYYFKKSKMTAKLMGIWSGRQWFVRSADDEIIAVNISPTSIVTRYFMLLYLQPVVPRAKKLAPLFICVDSMPWLVLKELRAKIAIISEH